MISNEKKYKWIQIAGSIDEFIFGENNLKEIDIDGKKICLAKTTSGLKACTSKCPHAGGNMSNGRLDKRGNIVCCVHNYSFNLTHGRDTLGEGYFLKTYPVKESEKGIFVGVEEMKNKV